MGTFLHLIILRLMMGLFEGPPPRHTVGAGDGVLPALPRINLSFTMNTANGLFSGVLAPIVIVALANVFDWRTAFFFTIVPGLLMAFVIWKVMRDPRATTVEAAEYGAPDHEGGAEQSRRLRGCRQTAPGRSVDVHQIVDVQ